MNEKNEFICGRLQITNDLNNAYCNIFDMLSKQKSGQQLNYIDMKNELRRICADLIIEISECKGLSNNIKQEAEQIIDILCKYQELLLKRINSLYEIINKLHKKAEGEGERYSIFAYNSDIKSLKELEKQNSLIGNSLQVYAVPFMRKFM